MKKLLCFGILILTASTVLAMGGPAPQKPESETKAVAVPLAEKVFLIDNFESGSIKSPREWWTFDLEKAAIASNKDLKDGDETVAAGVGNYSMQLSGPAKGWYAGGCGTYLAKEGQDLSKYSNFQMDIFGNGPGSGSIKVQLVDDDNNNWVVEQDPNKNFAVTKDDLWVYDVKVEWNGWKRVSIPFADFVIENSGAGDGIWNPQPTGGSGGLLQTQLICIGSTEKGPVNFNIDNVMLTMREK